MQAIKWIRKNKQPIMVVVVIFSMVIFVGGVGFTELLKYMGQGGKTDIATYDDGRKITNEDMANARHEIEVLDAIGAKVILFNKTNAYGMMDVNGQLLGHLLFGDTQTAARIRNQLRQGAQRGQIPLTTAQIDDFFNQPLERAEFTWILLNAEAQKAGIVVSNSQAAAVLRQLIPQLYEQLYGRQITAAQAIGQIATQMNLTNDQILAVYGKLMSISKWADQVCNLENTTLTQIRSLVGHRNNKIDPNYVEFPTDWFVSKQAQPTEDQIQAQFNAYKDFQPGDITDQNPYGFGYKLPKRVQLEYFYILNDDVKKIAVKPTSEALEEFYSNNINQFTDSKPKDPNDPQGDQITTTKSFVEVSEQIRQTIEQQNTEKLTQLIFKDARDLLDVELITLDMEKAEADQLRKAAVDYATVGAKITEKYKIPVHTGTTGLLEPSDFASDNCLARLRINLAGIQTTLLDAAFGVDPQNAVVPRKVGVYVPRMWENIGPLKSSYYSQDYTTIWITTLCRVVDVRPSEAPANIDVIYSTTGMSPFDTNSKKTFDLKQQIADDLKQVAAMDAAKAAAQELQQLIAKSDWDRAIEAYNTLYAPKDPNTIKDSAFLKLAVTSQTNQVLVPAANIEQYKQIMKDNPAMARSIQMNLVSNMLNQKLFDLLGDKTDTGVISQLVELKAARAWYVVMSIKERPATTEDYLQSKSFAALQATLDSSAAMGLIHFDPSQIIKRMNFAIIQQDRNEEASADKTAAKD
jgi:hypothetical protein